MGRVAWNHTHWYNRTAVKVLAATHAQQDSLEETSRAKLYSYGAPQFAPCLYAVLLFGITVVLRRIQLYSVPITSFPLTAFLVPILHALDKRSKTPQKEHTADFFGSTTLAFSSPTAEISAQPDVYDCDTKLDVCSRLRIAIWLRVSIVLMTGASLTSRTEAQLSIFVILRKLDTTQTPRYKMTTY
ncbi:unnamed protein product [Periconia digitata]|uniref:Uncharacterized protein n=1 Tax=Periconia digitata TaxID=1303443 RepID=A0A9W4UJT6_9PLEO|nr:unnamed protein product [Periconia digitata]